LIKEAKTVKEFYLEKLAVTGYADKNEPTRLAAP
jgi:hypothetical protein